MVRLKLSKLLIISAMLVAVTGLFGCGTGELESIQSEEKKLIATEFAKEYLANKDTDQKAVVEKYCSENVIERYEEPEVEEGDSSTSEPQKINTEVVQAGIESCTRDSESYVICLKQTTNNSTSYIPLGVTVDKDNKISTISSFTNKIKVIG